LNTSPVDEQEVTLADKSKDALDRAEATFRKKEQQAQESSKARAEYDAAARAVIAKTERLRSLRLAKEAAERSVELTSEPKRKFPASAKKPPQVGEPRRG
jgi:3-hydroxyacyl-CoA dehydrogenase